MSTLYHPFYCEENIWHLCQTLGDQPGLKWVVFISNPDRTVLFCNQRAGGRSGQVVWDYHVLLLLQVPMGWQVWDLDAQVSPPQDVETYLHSAFPYEIPPRSAEIPDALRPRFKLVPAAHYTREFASDRRHMRTLDKGWTQPPPPWACIGRGHILDALIDVESGKHGEVLDFEGFVERYAGHQ